MVTRRNTPKASEHVLAHRIPDISLAKKYVSRTIGGYRDLDLLKYAQDYQQNVLLDGPTGPGKSAMCYAYAALTRQPIVVISCNGGIDPNTFWGVNGFDEETQRIRWFWSDYAKALTNGPCVVLLDEVNMMPSMTAAANHTALRERFVSVLERGGEVLQVADDVLFVGTLNYGYKGTRELNEAFKNRFPMKIHVGYSDEVEEQLVNMPVVREMAQKLRQQADVGEIETPISTNMLMEFEQYALSLGMDFAVSNFTAAFTAADSTAVNETLNLHRERLDMQLDELEALLAEQED